MNNIIVADLQPDTEYGVSFRRFGTDDDFIKIEKVEKDKMIEYEEVKTIFKEYVVHNRTVTICVKEVEIKQFSLVYSRVAIGIAICNPEDSYNNQFGKKIAEGRSDKALTTKESVFMYTVGILYNPMRKNKFVLSQFAETAYYHFKHNPENYIVNFNKTIEDET